MIVAGNRKLHESIHTFSIPPIETCPNHDQCSRTCYAAKIYREREWVRDAWDRNYMESMNSGFVVKIENEIHDKQSNIIRIHVGGDFYSNKYIKCWAGIATFCPEVVFYGFSKTFGMLDLSPLYGLPNVNIIDSILPDGSINYGGVGYIMNKRWKFDYPVCPYSAGKNGIICGFNCSQCLTAERMLFVIH